MQTGIERLRAWIDRSKVNQTQAAQILGITPVFLSQILHGHREPGLATALRIEDITGISVRSWRLNALSPNDDSVGRESVKDAK